MSQAQMPTHERPPARAKLPATTSVFVLGTNAIAFTSIDPDEAAKKRQHESKKTSDGPQLTVETGHRLA